MRKFPRRDCVRGTDTLYPPGSRQLGGEARQQQKEPIVAETLGLWGRDGQVLRCQGGAQAVNPSQAEIQNDSMSPQPNAQSGRRGRVEAAQEAPCGDHQGMATSRIVTSAAPESEEEPAVKALKQFPMRRQTFWRYQHRQEPESCIIPSLKRRLTVRHPT